MDLFDVPLFNLSICFVQLQERTNELEAERKKTELLEKEFQCLVVMIQEERTRQTERENELVKKIKVWMRSLIHSSSLITITLFHDSYKTLFSLWFAAGWIPSYRGSKREGETARSQGAPKLQNWKELLLIKQYSWTSFS